MKRDAPIYTIFAAGVVALCVSISLTQGHAPVQVTAAPCRQSSPLQPDTRHLTARHLALGSVLGFLPTECSPERTGFAVLTRFFSHHLTRIARRIQTAGGTTSPPGSLPPGIDSKSVIGYEIDETGQVIPTSPFLLHPRDRMKHAMIFSQTGGGKSVLLRRMALSTAGSTAENTVIQDPRNEDLTETLLRHLVALAPPEHWVGRVGLIDLAAHRLSAHNPMYVPPGSDPNLIASNFEGPVVEMADSPGVRWEELFRNTSQALCQSEIECCPMDIPVFLSDRSFRERVLASVRDPFVLAYFKLTFDRLSDTEQIAWASSVNNKVSPFCATPVLRRLYRPERPFDFSRFLDEPPGKLLFISLRLNDVPRQSALLASRTIIRELLACAFAREKLPEQLRRPTHLLMDEISHMAGDQQMERAIVETRKYFLGLTGAAQSPMQIPGVERRRLFASNVQYTFVGRLGAADAAEVLREAGPDDGDMMKRRLMALTPGQLLVIERGKPARFIQVTKDADVRVDQGAIDALREIALDGMNARPVPEIDREIEARYAALLSGPHQLPGQGAVLDVRSAPHNRSHLPKEGATP